MTRKATASSIMRVRVPPPEKLRELWEEAQRKRKKKQLSARRKGKCRKCHNLPLRGPNETTCAPCHSEREVAGRRRRTKAKRKEAALVAKEVRKKARTTTALKRKLAAEGENRAYLDFLVN